MRRLNYFQAIQFLSKYIKPHRKYFARFYIGWFFDMLLSVMMPIMFGILVDAIVHRQDMDLFLRISFIFVVMSVFSCILYFLIYAQHQYLMNMYVYSIQKDVFSHVHKLKASYLSDSKSGDLVNIIQQHTRECMHFVIRNVIHMGNGVLRMIFIIIYLFIINPWIGIFTLLAAPLTVFINTKYGNKIRDYSNAERESYGTYSGYIFEVFSAVRDLRLLCAESRVFDKFNTYHGDIFKIKEKSALSVVTAQNIMNGTKLLVQISIFTLAAYFVAQNTMTIGLLTVVIAYFAMFSESVSRLSESYLDSQNRVGFIQRIFDTMNMPTEDEWQGCGDIDISQGELVFDKISFAYEGDNKVLENFSLNIQSGEKIALCGESGCGKTTVSYLLAGFYDNFIGNIYIDKQDIKECNLKSLRQNIGIVSQDVLMFARTIKENMLLGKPSANDDEIYAALEKAGILAHIKTLDEGINTTIGSFGEGLSGGQKQRIAIARIYLKNPKIIIFDEATNSLDQETEEQIHQQWQDVLKGRTAIVIAHRLSSVMLCDKAYIMENGKIVDCGEPNKLKDESSIFSHLFAIEGGESFV